MQLVKPVGGQRFASLDGLRGIACVVVVICHYLQIYVPAAFERNFPDLFGEKWLVNSPLNLLFNGHAAVILFFVLSGFVLSAPFFRGVGWGWYARSIIKRYPRLAIPALASSLLPLLPPVVQVLAGPAVSRAPGERTTPTGAWANFRGIGSRGPPGIALDHATPT